jgi:sporulation protein YlmC with PRC-barrel domain
MDLVRDVLDKKLTDREECEMGRVSGLLMQVGENTQPRVTHILIGGATLWARVHPALGRLSNRLARMWGPKRSEPVRIPWSRVETVGKDVKLDVKAKETGALDWEIWIAKHIIERIPGGGSEEEE